MPECADAIDDRLRLAVQRCRDQLGREEADAPQANHPGHAEQEADQRVSAPSRIAEQLHRRPDGPPGTGRHRFGARCSHASGSRSTKTIGTTRSAGRMPTKNSTRHPEYEPHECLRAWRNRQADERSDDVAHRRQRLQRSQRHCAELPGHALGHQRRRRAEHAADAEADEKAIDREVHPGSGKPRQAGEARVDEQRDDHRLHAPDLVAHHAEDDAAGRPAENHGRRCVAAVASSAAPPPVDRSQQLAQRRLAREDEEPLVHAVEQPAARGDDDDEPVIASDAVAGVRPPGRSVTRSPSAREVERAAQIVLASIRSSFGPRQCVSRLIAPR